MQRATVSSSPRTTCDPHTGQIGKRSSRLKRGRFRAPVAHRPDHLGNHVAGATHDDSITDAHILRSISSWLCNVALVTVTPPRIPAPAGDRRQRAGSAYLTLDVQETRHRLFGRILVRHSPARFATDKAELFLRSRRSTLYTTPSMSNGRLARLSDTAE